MSGNVKVTNTSIIRSVDANFNKAVDKIVKVLNDPMAKNSEVLNAADKIIKLRFIVQDNVRKEVMDRLDIEKKQLDLEEKKIKLDQLRGLPIVGSNSQEGGKHSTVFDTSEAVLLDGDADG